MTLTDDVLALWDQKFDTVDIAERLLMSEAAAVRLLHEGLKARRNEREIGRQTAPSAASDEGARSPILPGGRALASSEAWTTAAAAVLAWPRR